MSNSDILLKEDSVGSRGSLEADDAPGQARSFELLELIDVEPQKKQRHDETKFLPTAISRPFGGLFQRPLVHAVQEQSMLLPSQTQLVPSCRSFERMSLDARLVPSFCPFRPFEGMSQTQFLPSASTFSPVEERR